MTWPWQHVERHHHHQEQNSVSSDGGERAGDLSALLEIPALNLTPSSRGGRPQSVRSTSSFRGGPARRDARRKVPDTPKVTYINGCLWRSYISAWGVGLCSVCLELTLSIIVLFFIKLQSGNQ